LQRPVQVEAFGDVGSLSGATKTTADLLKGWISKREIKKKLFFLSLFLFFG